MKCLLRNIVAIIAAICATVPAIATEGPPVVIRLLTTDVEVGPTGLANRTFHFEGQASNDASAAQIAQQLLPYSEALWDVEIIDAYTIKANGQKLPVGPAAIYTQQPQGTANVPRFDDIRQKAIVFPNVAGGDTVTYTARFRAKQQLFPGQFLFADFFPKQVAFNEVRDTIVAPKNLPLNIQTDGVEFQKEETGDTITYRWHYSAPRSSDEEQPRVSPLDSVPRIIASTFKDYSDLGHAYADLAIPKTVVTPTIKELADQLTAGIADRRDQAKKIYEWVSKNIRYVALEFGTSAIVPHDAESILASAYGDCKDHSVLFSALLKAKGIDSELVLIDYGNAYTLSSVPMMMQFNHEIVWIPEFDLYADTTAGVAPFGTLPFAEYGKPVVHAVHGDGVVRRTPILPAGLATVSLKVNAHLDVNGKITGDSAARATGPFSIFLRGAGLIIQQAGAARFASAQLQSQGLVGTGSFDLLPPSDPGSDYSVTAHYDLAAKPDLVSGSAFPMTRGIWLTDATGDFLMGPLADEKLKDSEATACFSGEEDEELSLEPPAGKHFGPPPADFHIKTANLEFTSHWSMQGETMMVRRQFTSAIDQPLCNADVRKESARSLAQIRDHYSKSLVSLTGPLPAGAMDLNAGIAAARRGDNGEAIRFNTLALGEADIMPSQRLTAYFNRAVAYLRQREFDKAISDLSQAIKLDPKYARAFGLRGEAYLNKNDASRAIADFGQAIRINPNDSVAFYGRGLAYRQRRDLNHAFEDFNQATKIDPNYAAAYLYLGFTYGDEGEFESAIHEYDQAIKLNPTFASALNGRGIAYMRLHQLDLAFADFDRAIKIDPKYADPLNNRGLIYGEKNDFQHAIQDYDQAIGLNANFALAYGNRGRAKIKLGDTAGGEADIKKARALDPNIGRVPQQSILGGLLDGLF